MSFQERIAASSGPAGTVLGRFIANRKFARLIPYALRQWRYLTVICALTFLSSGLLALQPWPMKILIDYGLKREPVPAWLHSALAALHTGESAVALVLAAGAASIGFFALSSLIGAVLDLSWAAAGQQMANGVAADLFYRLQRRSLLYHRRSSVGDLLTRITTDTWCVNELTASLLITPAKNAITLYVLGVAAWSLNPQLAILTLMLAPLLACSRTFFGRKLKQRARGSREAQSRLLGFVQQTLSSIPIVQAFSREDLNRKRFEALADEAIDWSQRGALVNSFFGMVNGLISTAGVAIVLYIGGRRVLEGSISIGTLLVFLSYARSLQAAAEGLLSTYGTLKPVEASVERVLEVLDCGETVVERPAAPCLSRPVSGTGRHIALENVTFGYEPGRPFLRNISMEAKPGDVVALVGETGAGKTTLVSLIPRFFDPWEGRVTMDGVDIRDVTLASVRREVALVLQEPFILPLTVAENIAFGRPEAAREEIVAAATVANAHSFIERLPQGYDTVVGERGATLSGGEKQRLSIARALLKNAPILILDEPTSALDAGTESLLMQALERLMAGRTTFIVAHRLSTVRRADQILVLSNGRVVERGGHNELIRAGGVYHRFCALQTSTREVGA